MAMTLTQLKSAIQSYLEETESTFVDNLENFIRMTEQRVLNRINLPATRKTVTGTLTIGNDGLDISALTDPFLAPISLQLTVSSRQKFLLNKEMNYLDAMYPAATTGEPELYAQENETYLRVRPTPDVAYPYELTYYAKAASIITTGSSWLGDNFESVLLWGACKEGAIFLKMGSDQIGTYEAAFQEQMTLLEELIDGKNQRDQYRSGTRRIVGA